MLRSEVIHTMSISLCLKDTFSLCLCLLDIYDIYMLYPYQWYKLQETKRRKQRALRRKIHYTRKKAEIETERENQPNSNRRRLRNLYNLHSLLKSLVELGDLGGNAQVNGTVTDLDDETTDELRVDLFH